MKCKHIGYKGEEALETLTMLKSSLLREILIELESSPKNAYKISKRLKKDYSQVHKAIKKLIGINLIQKSTNRDKRSISYKLTDNGKSIVKIFSDFQNETSPYINNFLIRNGDEIKKLRISESSELKILLTILLDYQERYKKTGFMLKDETIKTLDIRHTIKVIGIGGAGNNCVSMLTKMGIHGADIIAVNTDSRHLENTKAHKKIFIGKELTRGLGAGGYPDIGKRAAEDSEKELRTVLEGVDMVYLVTGLGGGTGTGATPVIARIAKEMGAIVIGCTTMPFKIEGARMGKAEDGLYQLRQVCDTVIVIENDRLLKIAGDLPLEQAFAVADNLISTIIKGVTETITQASLINLDYADVKTIMHSGGVAAVGFGESDTKNRAEEAIIKAMTNPLLEVNYEGGTGAIIHITGGQDMRLDEVNLIGEYVSKQLDPDAQVIWGARINPGFEGKIRVITIISGVKSPYILGPKPIERIGVKKK